MFLQVLSLQPGTKILNCWKGIAGSMKKLSFVSLLLGFTALTNAHAGEQVLLAGAELCSRKALMYLVACIMVLRVPMAAIYRLKMARLTIVIVTPLELRMQVLSMRMVRKHKMQDIAVSGLMRQVFSQPLAVMQAGLLMVSWPTTDLR
ncbi:hypothetical protein [Pseudovibrio sp. WM33]|uniref:hypothetical protein n=1 Tax=Pseudovibrio sp. WM33 TaxID=1735585 RepID=UPI0007AE4E37|nr:hypothetical protein [Pseudovibrio sp. WM33]